jgi:feruloyl esterase
VVAPAIKFEVWMPTTNWNGKFQGVGNGGFAGVISYGAMRTALTRGYATASTDTGHVGDPAVDSIGGGLLDTRWASGHPELVIDWGHRGIHEMTVKAKAIIQGFYGSGPRFSYFTGCSGGGRQGVMEAQRYPGDYDGIVAGDPTIFFTHLVAGGRLWVSLATLKDPDLASFIPASKVQLIADAVNARCDALDGVRDGIVDDPRRCDFNPERLQCQSGDAANCLTAPQVEAVKKIYAGARNSAGEQIYPGYLPGGELGPGGWTAYIATAVPFTGTQFIYAQAFFKYMVFENPAWDFRTFNYDTDVPFMDAKLGDTIDGMNPDLRAFERLGAKMIVYHGWNDPGVSPLNTVNYYESVRATIGRKRNVNHFLRLFMVPGMQHCSGGPGPDSFDSLTALERWVEHGIAPKQIIASKLTSGVVTRTRPLCPYPQVARYKGKGSTDDAANFRCEKPRHESNDEDDDD